MRSHAVVELLAKSGTPHSVHQFDYEAGGGTRRSSAMLGVPEHLIIKSLIFQGEQYQPLMVLMHGDRNVDLKALAAQAGMSKICSCSPEAAEGFSGWPVGATNPFIVKNPMPIYLEASVMECSSIFINGGGRGFLVQISPKDLLRLVEVRLVRCAKEKAVLVSKVP